MPQHLGFIDSVRTATSSMMKQPVLATCSEGQLNHRTVVGVSREAITKLWDVMESMSLSCMSTTHRSYVMMGRNSSHYMQLFSNMPTPISMRTSRVSSYLDGCQE